MTLNEVCYNVREPVGRLVRSRRNPGRCANYLGCLLLVFLACKQFQLLQTMVVWFCAALNRRCLVCKDLIVECIDKKRPFPIPSIVLEYRHVGYNDFNRMSCIPVSIDFVREPHMFFSRFLVGVFPCFGANTGLLAAFMCQIMRKYPSGSFKDSFCKHMVSMRRVLLMLLCQQFG